jgi:hypothetical protein
VNFPDLIKDPADIVLYTMDWTSRLSALPQIGSPPAAPKIASAVISVNGDCLVVDETTYPSTGVLKLQVSGGSDTGFTGDPQIATLSQVTVVATLSDGEIFSRSFNVIERHM